MYKEGCVIALRHHSTGARRWTNAYVAATVCAAIAVITFPGTSTAKVDTTRPVEAPVFHLPAPDVDSFPLDRVAEHYAKDVGVSHDEAVRRLELQERANGLTIAAKQMLGDQYAGVWFDKTTGDVRVGVTNEADWDSVEELLADHMGQDAPLVAQPILVDDSRLDLQAAQADLDAQIQKRAAAMWTAIDDVNNRVVIGLGTDTRTEDAQWARSAREEFVRGKLIPGVPTFPQLSHDEERQATTLAQRRVEVEIVQTDRPATRRTRLCNSALRACSAPLHGGAEIQVDLPGNFVNLCSAGFMGYWNSGSGWVPYLITAGHCVLGASSVWRSHYAGSGAANIGRRHTWRFGRYGTSAPSTTNDIALITVDHNSHWASGQRLIPRTVIAMWGWPYGGWDYWRLSAQDIAAANRYGCRSGRTTNFSCGSVQFQSVTYPVDDTYVGNNFNVPTTCSQGGDSGGPFVDGGIGLGMLSSGSGCDDAYQHVWDAGYHFGAWLFV